MRSKSAAWATLWRVASGPLLVVAGLLAMPASKLLAHSNLIGVAAVVEDGDGESVNVVRLHQGLAQRSGDAWHYVCPSLYQGMGQDLAAPLPGGGVAIAAPSGIFVMARDGMIAPHPDAGAAGQVTAFARGPGVLYALRLRSPDIGSEVIEIGADTVSVLWSDEHYWSDIAVGASFLQIVRADQDTLWGLQLSTQAEILAEQSAPLVDVAAINARVIGDVPYFIAKFEQRVELGQIEQGSWQVLQSATTNIAGPAETADGARFLALDGKLASMDAEVLTPRMDPDYVISLGRLEDRSYACTRTGSRYLTDQGLGDTLFDLAQLQPPNPCVVPDAIRSQCNLEWQHIKVEFSTVNVALATPSAQAAECEPAPSMEASMEPSPVDSAVEEGAAGTASAPVDPMMPIVAPTPISPPPASGGCNIGRQQNFDGGLLGYALLFAVAPFMARRRPRRR